MTVFILSRLCLLILISLFGKAQQVTASDNLTCNDRQYQHESGKCCARCPPGTYAKKECTETTDTQCQPCKDGEYTTSWNYASKCKTCKECDLPLVKKENCSSTSRELCVCPEGFECHQSTALGVCMLCMPIPSPTVTNVLEITQVRPWLTPVIIATVITVCIAAIVTFIILAARSNTTILEKLGCMPKMKKPEPESTGDQPSTTKALLTADDNLQYPIEETSATQSAEYALNSTRQNPI